MTEKVKKPKTVNLNWKLLVMLFISIVIAAAFAYGYIISESENRRIATLNEITTADLEKSKAEITNCHNELDSLKKRIEGIKNADDLLKRDIFLYVDKKFQIIPRTVALDIAEQVLTMSKKENISPELVVGIIQVESGFNPMAISKKNARGLMQVMPEWAPKFNLKKVSDLHDIDTNIQCGTKVLKIHIEEGKGSISKGLYYYVGKSDSYAAKVYEAMGKFVAFRSTIDDEDASIDINGDEETEKPKSDEEGEKDKGAAIDGAGKSNS